MNLQSPTPHPHHAEPFVLGLDWISSSRGWACCQLNVDSGHVELGCLPCDAIAGSVLVRGSACVVVDAPMGLRDGAGVCLDRECDKGARHWLGKLKPSVFPPPVAAELQAWRNGGPRRQGHARGLLPAIASAEDLRSANPQTLESHPELVFAALAGKPLPLQGKKTTLLGLLARVVLLRQPGIALELSHFADRCPIPTDNYLDAIAMALVARAWARLGDDLRVIRSCNGEPESLGATNSRSPLMALPETEPRGVEESPMTSKDLLALASLFRPRDAHTMAAGQ